MVPNRWIEHRFDDYKSTVIAFILVGHKSDFKVSQPHILKLIFKSSSAHLLIPTGLKTQLVFWQMLYQLSYLADLLPR